MTFTFRTILLATAGLTFFTTATRAQPVPDASTNVATKPVWPKPVTAPRGAPNVIVIMLDDVGFAASSTFGGPIPTPTLDALARTGARFNRFHTTAMCSPSRAALLTGRDQHNVGMGSLTNFAAGYDGYNTVIPKSAATVARVLKDGGYSTAMFGKAHITPEWEQSSSGPFDRWPTGLGFEYFYGFLNADTSGTAPSLIENTAFIEPPYGRPDYHLDNDLADRTIDWIHQQRANTPDKPFFVYYASSAMHAPQQAPKEWLEKFRGTFDAGWDKVREETFGRQLAAGIVPKGTELTPRPAGIPAWDSLGADDRKLYARLMESAAAALGYADAQIGRIVEDLRKTGELDNTMIVFIEGDNGPSAEGGLSGALFEQSNVTDMPEERSYMQSRIDDIGSASLFNNYPVGWAWAMATPFKYYKQVASHFGGTRNGMLIAWPGRIKDAGAVRSQFVDISDIMPTILAATGVNPPTMVDGVAQKPLDGISFLGSLANPTAPSSRHAKAFEMLENVGIYRDGWMASTTPYKDAWDYYRKTHIAMADRKWELYHVDRDFSQAHDLAAQNPAKLKEMQALFWQQAKANNFLPVHPAFQGIEGRPRTGPDRDTYVYHSGVTRVSDYAAPPTLGRSFTISARVDVGDDASGVMVAHGGRYGGYSFYLDRGRPVFAYNAIDPRHYRIAGTNLSRGKHRIDADIALDSAEPHSGATVTISVDGRQVGTGRIERTLSNWISLTEGLDVGRDTITAVSSDYTPPTSIFTGKIDTVTIMLKPKPTK